MAIELKKAVPVTLRSLGLDEKWLQDQISRDPSLLGLGELEIAGKEHHQPFGGRIDFLMRNVEAETYYEIEIMLGTLDESHIIRTVEYWDVERQRRPTFDHRAVIVAERITARFFNILRLLNRAVPMIAVQLSVFRMGDAIVIHPVTVLDVVEETADDVPDAERADRTYWEKRPNPTFLKSVDFVASLLRNSGFSPRVTYNRHHIALGTTGYNFCWFSPRAVANHCRIELRLRSGERRDAVLASLGNAGIDASPRQADSLTFNTTSATLEEHSATMGEVFKSAEEAASAKASSSVDQRTA